MWTPLWQSCSRRVWLAQTCAVCPRPSVVGASVVMKSPAGSLTVAKPGRFLKDQDSPTVQSHPLNVSKWQGFGSGCTRAGCQALESWGWTTQTPEVSSHLNDPMMSGVFLRLQEQLDAHYMLLCNEDISKTPPDRAQVTLSLDIMTPLSQPVQQDPVVKQTLPDRSVRELMLRSMDGLSSGFRHCCVSRHRSLVPL